MPFGRWQLRAARNGARCDHICSARRLVSKTGSTEDFIGCAFLEGLIRA